MLGCSGATLTLFEKSALLNSNKKLTSGLTNFLPSASLNSKFLKIP